MSCYAAPVARSSPAELNQPPILKAALCGLFYFRKQQKEHCGVTGSLPNLHHLAQCSS